MARTLVAVYRGEPQVEAVRRASRLMMPDNIDLPDPLLLQDGGVVAATCNPDPKAPVSQNGVVVGHFFEDARDWDQVGGGKPDGSYALCRWSAETVEVVTDIVGSRSLWFAQSDDLFAVSSSIGAIVALLGSFEFDPEVIPWVLATGSLGEKCWDRRIRRCPADSVLTFDRKTRALDIQAGSVEFGRAPVDFGETLDRHFANLRVPDGSVITLSGGVDSRAVLAAMPDPRRYPCITWGTRDAARDPQNDVAVAKAVADRLGAPHRFLEIKEDTADVETMVSRFVDVSEGRIDHVSGYADGFALWKQLREAGVERIIRGDEGFIWKPALNEDQTRRDVGLSRMADFFTQEQLERFGLAEAEWPNTYFRRDGESLETWRDRLYHLFRLPTVLASLSDIKAAYVEIVNPLLARDVILAARRLSDTERTGKVAFRRWAIGLGPKLPYAKASGTARVQDLLRTPEFGELVEKELADADCLTPAFREHVIGRLRGALMQRRRLGGIKAWLRKALPAGVKARLRATQGSRTVPLDPTILAMRALIIARMHRYLSARAQQS